MEIVVVAQDKTLTTIGHVRYVAFPPSRELVLILVLDLEFESLVCRGVEQVHSWVAQRSMVLDPLPSGRWRRRASCAASPKAIVFGTRLRNRPTPVHTSLQLERIMCARLSLSLAADPTFFVFAKPGEASPAAAPFLLEMGSPRAALPGYLTYPPYPSHSFVLIFGVYPSISVVPCIPPRQFPAPRIYLPATHLHVRPRLSQFLMSSSQPLARVVRRSPVSPLAASFPSLSSPLLDDVRIGARCGWRASSQSYTGYAFPSSSRRHDRVRPARVSCAAGACGSPHVLSLPRRARRAQRAATEKDLLGGVCGVPGEPIRRSNMRGLMQPRTRCVHASRGGSVCGWR
jgi:hypothetical protein